MAKRRSSGSKRQAPKRSAARKAVKKSKKDYK
jgi:hypothetical protein